MHSLHTNPNPTSTLGRISRYAESEFEFSQPITLRMVRLVSL